MEWSHRVFRIRVSITTLRYQITELNKTLLALICAISHASPQPGRRKIGLGPRLAAGLAFTTILAGSARAQVPDQVFREIFGTLRRIQTEQMPPPRVGASPTPAPANILSSKPTFDCSKSRTALALTLCTDEHAARADWDVNAAAWAYAFTLEDDERRVFWDQHTAWIKSVSGECRLTSRMTRSQRQCVVNVYHERAKALRSKLTGDALAEAKLTPEQRAEIQARLASLNLLTDAPDGQFGPSTRAAIRRWRQTNGFAPGDYITKQQRELLTSLSELDFINRLPPAMSQPTGIPRPHAEQSSQPPGAQQAQTPPLMAVENAPAAQEFALLTTKPAVCEDLHRVSREAFAHNYTVYNERQSPVCQMLLRCGEAVLARSRALVLFLERNPPVVTTLQSYEQSVHLSSNYAIERVMRQLKALAGSDDRKWFNMNSCDQMPATTRYSLESNFIRISSSLPTDAHASAAPSLDILKYQFGVPAFEAFSIVGRSLLNMMRDQYRGDTEGYADLIAFNDRYTGVENLENAYAAYRHAFENYDVTGLISLRSEFLEGMKQAKAHQLLLTQQTGQISRDEQMLREFAAVVDREDLANFTDRIKPLLSDVGTELGSLRQSPPGKRGDISGKLDSLAMRIREVETAIHVAQAAKSEAERVRRTLVEEEEAGRQVVSAATSPELKETFSEEFKTSANDLIASLRKLQSIDLWAIRDKQAEISDAARKLTALQLQVSDARARFDRAKTFDQMRRTVMIKLSDAVDQFSRPEYRNRLSSDGIAVVTDVQTQLEALSQFNNVPLIIRSDYSGTLAAADNAFGRMQKINADIQQMAEFTGGVRRLTDKIDQRGRNLLDGPASTQFANLSTSSGRLSGARFPLSPEGRRQLADARADLDQFDRSIDAVMDREEKKSLVLTLPTRKGLWEFTFDKDKMTDEELARAVGHAEGSQAKYELSIVCRHAGPEFLISTFQIHGTESKRIPWDIDVTGPDASERIRLRIDSNPAFTTRFNLRGYGNQGEVDIKADFHKILHSSQLVFADLFPDEQVEVPTTYPREFARLCELLTQRTDGLASQKPQ